MTENKPIGLYIHIPFCRSKCPYCDFYSFRTENSLKEEYVSRLFNYLQTTGKNYIFDTVYFGGGTPSQLNESQISRILETVNCTNDAEVTMECNPSDSCNNSGLDFRVLKEAGINRISMGLQSAVDSERKMLGRKAGITEVSSSIERIKNAGISNISLDLMIGIPNQNTDTLKESLSYCVSSEITHISAYMLKIEKGTVFDKRREAYSFPDDDLTADMYLQTIETLSENGFIHYEVSNFSKPGFESKHNLKYWHCKDYLGVGPAAHSFIDGKRFYYPNDIQYFLEGKEPIQDGIGGTLFEYIMLGLRLSEGISLKFMKEKFQAEFPPEIMHKISLFENAGYVSAYNETIRLTGKGFLISNNIISELTEWL